MRFAGIRLEAGNKKRVSLVASAFAPGADKLFALDAQSIGDAIDVIKKADDLRRVMDGDIVQAS